MLGRQHGEVSPLMMALGLLMMVLIFGSMSFPIQKFFSTKMDTTINDLDRIADTKAHAQLYFYNYVPTSAMYSTYQNSYELAKQGGSPNLEWDSDIFSGESDRYHYNPGVSCRSMELLNRIQCRVGKNVTEDLQENYISGSSDGRCERPDYNLDVYFDQKSYSLEGNVFAFSPIENRCRFPDGRVMYRANNSFINLNFKVSGNRYMKLAEEAKRLTKGLYEEFKNVDDYYVGTATACGSKDFESAEQEAVNSAESAVRNAFSSAPAGSTVSSMVVEERKITGPSDSFPEGASTDVFSGSTAQSSSSIGDCGCNENGTNCETEYRAKVNVTLEKTNVKLVLEDRFSKIPVNSGKKYMEFVVDSYTHHYQKD
ncbi:MAG: hypothetical protein ABEJ83_00445 [Candidatus Nanohaloarchaea archaeon]